MGPHQGPWEQRLWVGSAAPSESGPLCWWPQGGVKPGALPSPHPHLSQPSRWCHGAGRVRKRPQEAAAVSLASVQGVGRLLSTAWDRGTHSHRALTSVSLAKDGDTEGLGGPASPARLALGLR